MWLLLYYLAVACLLGVATVQGDQIKLSALEQEAVYRTFESINSEVPWRTLYPDDLCLSAPHGLVCDFFTTGNTTTLHVTELNFGYFSANPSCGPNATLPSHVPFPRLRGSIPAAIGRCEHLKMLNLSGNRLGGRIPATIGRIGKLAKLDLSSNRISGPVPVELAGLRCLELLDLSRNRLTGGVPAALSGMRALLWLDLSGNGRLGGRIPPDIWANLGGILWLGLSGVGLVGDIPASMGLYLQNVRHLALDNNALDGELPEQLRRLELTADEINLANNSLRGQLPFSVAFVARMGGKLKLSGNPLLCLGPAEDLEGPTLGQVDQPYLPPCNGTVPSP